MQSSAGANAVQGVSSIELFTKVAQERIRHRLKGEVTCGSEVIQLKHASVPWCDRGDRIATI